MKKIDLFQEKIHFQKNQILMNSLIILGLFITQTILIASENSSKPLNDPDPLPKMVEKIAPSVVNISSTTVLSYTVYGMDDFLRLWGIPQERKHTSLGSGFILNEEGLILTNHHVIEKATEVIITLSDQRKFRGKIIGKDDKMDLALLQIRDDQQRLPENLHPVTLGNSDQVRIAETVIAVGNPFGLQNTVTRGIISAKHRTIGLGPLDNFLQTDASINPGNSGGPLFNIHGEVIGINSAIHSETGQNIGLGFAIPINEAKNLLPDLKKYGRIPRPWLGIVAETLSPQLQHYYQLASAEGILITNLVEEGPADLAGLRQGDILVGFQDQPLQKIHDLEKALYRHKPFQTVHLKLYRGKKIQTVKLQLKELPRLEKLPRGIL